MATVNAFGTQTLSLVVSSANTSLWPEPAGLYVPDLLFGLNVPAVVMVPLEASALSVPQTVETDYWMRVHQSQTTLGGDIVRLNNQTVVLAMELGTPGNAAATGTIPQGRIPDSTLQAHYPLSPSFLTG